MGNIEKRTLFQGLFFNVSEEIISMVIKKLTN